MYTILTTVNGTRTKPRTRERPLHTFVSRPDPSRRFAALQVAFPHKYSGRSALFAYLKQPTLTNKKLRQYGSSSATVASTVHEHRSRFQFASSLPHHKHHGP